LFHFDHVFFGKSFSVPSKSPYVEELEFRHPVGDVGLSIETLTMMVITRSSFPISQVPILISN